MMLLRRHKLDARRTFAPIVPSDKNICSLGTDFNPMRNRRDEEDSRRSRVRIERAVSTRIEESIIPFSVRQWGDL